MVNCRYTTSMSEKCLMLDVGGRTRVLKPVDACHVLEGNRKCASRVDYISSRLECCYFPSFYNWKY